MLAPRADWTPFASFQEKLQYYRDWGLVPPKANWLRRVCYAGFYAEAPMPCAVVGYLDAHTAVLCLEGGLHTIAAELLAEQQAGAFAQPWPEAYVVFDLETTGLSPVRDRMIEIGALRHCDGLPDETFHTMVDPERPIPPGITALTGICDDDVIDAPAQHQAAQAFLDFADGLPLVAHNAKFDVGFLEHCEGKKLQNQIFDTLRLSQRAYPDEKHHTLAAMKELLHIDIPVAHRALADVMATDQLFRHCLEALNA